MATSTTLRIGSIQENGGAHRVGVGAALPRPAARSDVPGDAVPSGHGESLVGADQAGIPAGAPQTLQLRRFASGVAKESILLVESP
ncbi:hypothetical protein GCM10025780_35990 [Frondihabitans cladoniiphilus]|uniref:Uncharacterized protein n=1 Tax=Frondihabitans cladoniiphilus TaxID=715785 RepID=A0ABP8WBL2_9MICO